MANKQIHPYQGKEPYVFVSYSHRDSEQVLDLIELLQNKGYRVWYDEGIIPGSEWDDSIAEHIAKCDFFLALISNNYLASENCRDELKFVRDVGVARLLVYLENVELPLGMQMRLSRLQAIHKYAYSDVEQFFSKLKETEGLELCCGKQSTSEQAQIGTTGQKMSAPIVSKFEEKPVEKIGTNNINPLLKASIGDTVKFGHYDTCNEWIVLDKQDSKLLLLSKYAICKKKYHESYKRITWEECILRSWLNGTFFISAFSSDEQSSIIAKAIVNGNNPKYGTKGGNYTIDKVFLLSIDEIEKYLITNSTRQATLSDGVLVWWWLRSPGDDSYNVACVHSDGSVIETGSYVDNERGAVRPALWIDISNL